MCVVVIDLKQLLALALVAGVPDGNMEYPSVPHERRLGVDETNVAVRNAGSLSVSIADIAGQGYMRLGAVELNNVGLSFFDPPWGLYLFVGRSAGWSLHNQLDLV
jgi:hypothetical protein